MELFDAYHDVNKAALVADNDVDWGRIMKALDALWKSTGGQGLTLCLFPVPQLSLDWGTGDLEDFFETGEVPRLVRETIPENSFVSLWHTRIPTAADPGAQSREIQLPLIEEGSYDFIVHWGDGTTDHITEWDQPEVSHTYDEHGTYTVVIEGEIEGWTFPQTHRPHLSRRTEITPMGTQEKLLEIGQWGPLRLGNRGFYFAGATNLVVTATDVPDLTGTTDLSGMFAACMTLRDVPNINAWDVAHVTQMDHLFAGARLFDAPLDRWDTSSVTSMDYLFSGAESFDHPIGSWDTSQVSFMLGTFQEATSFDQDIGDWDTSSLQNAKALFQGARSFNRDISGWDISGLSSLFLFFDGAESFDQDLTDWDVSNVTALIGTFRDAKSFNGDISTWDTSKVRTMSATFAGATNFDGDLSGWDTSSVTIMSKLFYFARRFNQDVTSWDVSNVTDMGYLLYYATSFDRDLSIWDVSSVENAEEIFSYSGLSSENYHLVLQYWSNQFLRPGLTLGAKTLRSSPAASDGRRRLVMEHDWTIIDDVD